MMMMMRVVNLDFSLREENWGDFRLLPPNFPYIPERLGRD
jgi:hypothetical protein